MRSRTLFTLALAFALFGCSGSSGSSSGSSGASSSSSSSSSGGTGELSGTINGQSFSLVGGHFHTTSQGAIEIIASSMPATCDSAKQQKFTGGEAIVQIYGLKGTAPGDFTSGEVKYVTIKQSCASGAPIEANVDKAGRVEGTTTVKITAKSDTQLEGSMDVTFVDGSFLKGSFKVPSCANEMPEGATCK